MIMLFCCFLYSGIVGLSFTNRGRILHTVGNDGIASEMNSESGEVVRKFKVSKTHLSSSALYGV